MREGQELKVICYGDDSGKEVSFLPLTQFITLSCRSSWELKMKSLPQKLWFALITWPENLMATRRSNCLSPSMTPIYRPLYHGSKETQMFRYNRTFLTDRCSQEIIFWGQVWAQLKSWYISKPEPSLARTSHFLPSPSRAYLRNPEPSLARILNLFPSRAEPAKLGLLRLKPARALVSFLHFVIGKHYKF